MVGKSSKDGIRKTKYVSGEILLIDGPGGSATRLVEALGKLAEAIPSSEFALIGGLAVMTRLGRVHRATDDLDAVAQGIADGPSPAVDPRGRWRQWTEHRVIGGVKVDCIDVGSIEATDLDAQDLPEDEFDRAFLLAHRWGLDSATEAALTVLSAQRNPIATATCRVATPSALVSMKLQSAPRRRAEREHKGPQRLWRSLRSVYSTGVAQRHCR